MALSSGQQAASEPEVSALINLIAAQRLQQIVSLHAPMACVDYEQSEPWPLAKALSDRLQLPIIDNIGYPCPGSMDAWATGNGIRLLTLEIEDSMALSAIRQKYGPVMQDLLQARLPGL